VPQPQATDGGGGVSIRLLDTRGDRRAPPARSDADRVLDLVGALEAVEDVAAVDESELERLQLAAAGRAVGERAWSAILAEVGGDLVGYAGVVVEPPSAEADLVLARDAPASGPVPGVWPCGCAVSRTPRSRV